MNTVKLNECERHVFVPWNNDLLPILVENNRGFIRSLYTLFILFNENVKLNKLLEKNKHDGDDNTGLRGFQSFKQNSHLRLNSRKMTFLLYLRLCGTYNIL